MDRDAAPVSWVTLSLVAASGFVLYLAAALLNPGLVTAEDYLLGIARFLPAQSHSFAEIIGNAGDRSPLAAMFPWAIAKVALQLGYTEPRVQLQIVLAALAALAYPLLFAAAVAHFPRGVPEAGRRRLIAALLIGFYFLCPLFLSRALPESLTAPWLFASCAFASRYWQLPSRRSLFFAVLTLTVATAMCSEAGLFAFVLVLLPLFRGRVLDLLFGVLLVGVAFAVLGFIDRIFRGAFHASLYAEIAAMLRPTVSERPWYLMPAVIFLLGGGPLLLSRYRGLRFGAAYEPLLPTLLGFGAFLGLHALLPAREPRSFLVLLPLFLLLVAPLGAHLLAQASAGATGAKRRLQVFFLVDIALLALLTFFPPRKTALALAEFAQRNPGVARFLVEERVLFPQALVDHPVAVEALAALASVSDCATVAAVLPFNGPPEAITQNAWQRVDRFEPGPLERLVVLLNPLRNKRRGPVELYARAGCAYRSVAGE